MSLFDWIYGFNRQDEVLDRLGKNKKILRQIVSLSKGKIKFLKKAETAIRKEDIDAIERFVDSLEKINASELSSLSKQSLISVMTDLPLSDVVKSHIIGLLRQYIKNINEQKKWFATHKTFKSRRTEFREIELLIKTETSILFGLVHRDMTDLEKDIRTHTRQLLNNKEEFDVIRQEKTELDGKVLSIAKETNNFEHVYVGEKEEISDLTGKYRLIINDIDELLKSKELDKGQRDWLNRFKEEVELQVQQIDPILKDPHINPYSDTLSHSKTVHMMERIRPCQVVLSKQSLLNILKSRYILSKLMTGTDKKRYESALKEQEDAIFVSAGGPYSHLNITNIQETVVIVFKPSLYRLNMTIYPRDSGGYPEVDFDVPLDKASEEIKYLVKRRQFKNYKMMFRYMFNHIKHRRLRRTEKNSIVGLKLPKPNMALFPELVIKTKIDLKYVEAIIVPEQVYNSIEMVKFKKKYNKNKDKPLIKPAKNTLDGYWEHVGLKAQLFD